MQGVDFGSRRTTLLTLLLEVVQYSKLWYANVIGAAGGAGRCVRPCDPCDGLGVVRADELEVQLSTRSQRKRWAPGTEIAFTYPIDRYAWKS